MFRQNPLRASRNNGATFVGNVIIPSKSTHELRRELTHNVHGVVRGAHQHRLNVMASPLLSDSTKRTLLAESKRNARASLLSLRRAYLAERAKAWHARRLADKQRRCVRDFLRNRNLFNTGASLYIFDRVNAADFATHLSSHDAEDRLNKLLSEYETDLSETQRSAFEETARHIQLASADKKRTQALLNRREPGHDVLCAKVIKDLKAQGFTATELLEIANKQWHAMSVEQKRQYNNAALQLKMQCVQMKQSGKYKW